jgi:hypothetical protein
MMPAISVGTALLPWYNDVSRFEDPWEAADFALGGDQPPWTHFGHSHSYLGLDRKRLCVQVRTGSVP